LPYNDFFLLDAGLLRRLGTAVVALANQNDAADTRSGAALADGELTNPGAQGSIRCPVDAPTAGEKVCDGRYRLSVATRAGTDGQDKVAQ